MPPEAGQASEEQQALTRKSHLGFITRIYIISTVLLGFAVMHWFALTEIKTIHKMISKNSQLGMLVGFFAYLGLLCMIHFYEILLKRTCLLWIYTLIMAELGSVSVAMAISEGYLRHVVYTFIVTSIILTICVILSKNIQDSLFRDMKYLTSWTIRFYIIALMGIVISLSVGEEYVEAFVLMFTASFMTMFMFVFAKSLSSSGFFAENQSRELFLALMFYYNFASVWSAIVMTFEAATAEAEHEE